MFWSPTVAALGDVGTFVVQVAKGLQQVTVLAILAWGIMLSTIQAGYKCPTAWVQKLKARDGAKEKANIEKGKEPVVHTGILHS